MTSSNTRNKYTREFKLEAIALVKDQGYTFADAGRALSVNPNLISRWSKEHETGESVFQGHGAVDAGATAYSGSGETGT